MMAKTVVEKLNLTKFATAALIDVPESEKAHFTSLSGYDEKYRKDTYDLIFAFVFSLKEFKETVLDVIRHNRLNKKGYLFLAYPKKGNNVYPDAIHRDDIFPSLNVGEDGYVGESAIKFARMVSLDETFTIVGLKEDAAGKGKTSTASSQCVDDYIDDIPKIEAYLSDKPALADFYKKLTPGYRKDWARYVFSAKREATRKKRLSEMEVILGKGFKSKDLYRQSQS